MAIRRRGEPQLFGSSVSLPPTQERVRRLIEDEGTPGLRTGLRTPRAVDLWRAPLPARMLVSESVVARPRARFRAVVRSPLGVSRGILGVLKGLYLRSPWKVHFCVQRKQRKEVLFALRKVGFRGSSPGSGGGYRRGGDSSYSCR